jgi:putative ABC transport system ATP-binding protein
MLELTDLVKHYTVGEQEPVRAVDGVSLAIAPGELVALYGPSGSGKTTLLMLIAALLHPDSGSIVLDGREISALSESAAAAYRLSELGFVRQSLNLVPGVSALDNAALKLLGTKLGAREAHRRVTPLLEQLGLGERLRNRPDQLSMGERQRVMIARAPSTEPKLLLADEPTGSLDTRRGREVLELLTGICREHHVAVLLVTHDPRAAMYADRVHSLCDGRLENHESDEIPALLDAEQMRPLHATALELGSAAEVSAEGPTLTP